MQFNFCCFADRNGRGTLKGYKAIKKWHANNQNKLPIQFSTTLGGVIGANRRSFIDDILVQMRHHAPLIGVETWSKGPKNNKDRIVQKVLVRISFSFFQLIIHSCICIFFTSKKQKDHKLIYLVQCKFVQAVFTISCFIGSLGIKR